MPTAVSAPKAWWGEGRRPNAGTLTFSEWVKQRKTMSEDEIFDIEAKTQRLIKSKKPAKEKIKRPRTPVKRLPKTRVYPAGWKDYRVAGITIPDAGTYLIVKPRANYRTFITAIVFTVDAPTLIKLIFGTMGSSGPMNFGDTDQPRGIASNHDQAPAPCGLGGFSISSYEAGVSVAGYVIYYQEPDEAPS